MGGPLRKHATHQEARSSAPDVVGVMQDDRASLNTKKSRLRSLSETFGGLLSSSSRDRDRKYGKRREDMGGNGDNGGH
jgi:hypothetical protein